MKESECIPTTELPEAVHKPIVRAIHLLGDPWILLIVINLLPGSKRFNELRTLIGHISPKTLSQRLKLLEEITFVERRAFLEIPPRVEYHLTEKGLALGGVIGAIEAFANEQLKDANVVRDEGACSEENKLSTTDRECHLGMRI